MKRSFSSLCAGLLVFAASGTLCAQELEIKTSAPWQTLEDKGRPLYSFAYPGSGWAALEIKASVKPETYYKVSWEMKSSVEEPESVFGLSLKLNETTGCVPYRLSSAWSTYAFYFHSSSANAVTLRLYVNPSQAKDIEVKELTLGEMKPEDFTANLLADGDFEGSAGIPTHWRSTENPSAAKIVSMKDFLSGEKSLEIDFKGQQFRSVFLPVVLGKSYELRFWAKTDGEFPLFASINSWVLFGKHRDQHFWLGKSFKITAEWKEYALKVSIPSDVGKYPDLEQRIVFLSFCGAQGAKGKVLLDGLVFHEVKE